MPQPVYLSRYGGEKSEIIIEVEQDGHSHHSYLLDKIKDCYCEKVANSLIAGDIWNFGNCAGCDGTCKCKTGKKH